MLTQVESRLLLNVVVRESTPVLKLLPGEDETLLVGRDAAGSRSTRSSPLRFEIRRYLPLLVLDLSLDIVNGVGGLDLKGDGLSSKSLNEDLHCRRIRA